MQTRRNGKGANDKLAGDDKAARRSEQKRAAQKRSADKQFGKNGRQKIRAQESPDDAEALRHELVRRLAAFTGSWRRCDAAACRRARTCCVPLGKACLAQRRPNVREKTDEQFAYDLAALRKMAAQRFEELQAREDAP